MSSCVDLAPGATFTSVRVTRAKDGSVWHFVILHAAGQNLATWWRAKTERMISAITYDTRRDSIEVLGVVDATPMSLIEPSYVTGAYHELHSRYWRERGNDRALMRLGTVRAAQSYHPPHAPHSPI